MTRDRINEKARAAAREQLREQVALFRYGVICELLPLAPRSKQLSKLLGKQSRKTHRMPGSRRTRVAKQTIKDWMRLYRTGGFDALKPKRRGDRGRPGRMPVEAVEAMLAIRRDNPALSIRDVIVRACEQGVPRHVPLPKSTARRLLQREAPGDAATPPDRRRFACEKAGQLWMSDVMHGPKALADARRRRKTCLIAFPDDAMSRGSVFGLRVFGKHPRLFEGHAAGSAAARHSQAPVRRQRRQLPLQAAGRGVRPARHRIDPRASVPACGKGQDRKMFPHLAQPLRRPPARPRGA